MSPTESAAQQMASTAGSKAALLSKTEERAGPRKQSQASPTTGILFDPDQAGNSHQTSQYASPRYQSERFIQYLNTIRDKRKQRQGSLLTTISQEQEMQAQSYASHFASVVGASQSALQTASPSEGFPELAATLPAPGFTELGGSLGP